MISTIINFFIGKNPLNYIFIVLFGLSFLFGAYKLWEHNIKQQALLEFNQKQLEQVIKDQQKFNDILTNLNTKQQDVLDKLEKQNADTEKNMGKIDEYLNSDLVKKLDRPSSEILKNVIKQLSGQK